MASVNLKSPYRSTRKWAANVSAVTGNTLRPLARGVIGRPVRAGIGGGKNLLKYRMRKPLRPPFHPDSRQGHGRQEKFAATKSFSPEVHTESPAPFPADP